jgi:hypothetical protein
MGHLPGEKDEALTCKWDKLSTQLEQETSWFSTTVGEGESPSDSLRMGYPEFSQYFKIRARTKIERECIGEELAQARRQRKSCWIGNGLSAKAEAGKDSHQGCPQSVGGTQGKGWRISAPGLEFPDMVVEVVGGAQAKISRQGEGEWIPRAKRPSSHRISIRSFLLEVKGFVLE